MGVGEVGSHSTLTWPRNHNVTQAVPEFEMIFLPQPLIHAVIIDRSHHMFKQVESISHYIGLMNE